MTVTLHPNTPVEHVTYRRGAWTLGSWTGSYCPFCPEHCDREVDHDHYRLVTQDGSVGYTAEQLCMLFCANAAALVEDYSVPTHDGEGWISDPGDSEYGEYIDFEGEVTNAEGALADNGYDFHWEDGYTIERVIERPKVGICTREWGGPIDTPSEWWMFASRQARRLKVKAATRKRAEINYVMTWHDADPDYPFGLELAHATWVPDGQVVYQ